MRRGWWNLGGLSHPRIGLLAWVVALVLAGSGILAQLDPPLEFL